MIDQMYNFLVKSWRKLSDEISNNTDSAKEDRTIIRYSPNANGSNMTTTKEAGSKYIGFLSVPQKLYNTRNLAKNTAYPYASGPPFMTSASSISNIDIEDGFRCTKVETETGSSSLQTGIRYNNSDLYTQFKDNDDIAVSFLIKGSVSSWSLFGFDYAIETGTVNKKTSYPNWERVIWYGKNTILESENIGAFQMKSPGSSTSYTYFIREFCVQKTLRFKSYTVAPEDLITDRVNFTWIPITVVQSDWNVTDNSLLSFIKNKPTSMPASDVSAWAKATTKPSYGYTEITGKPGSVTITVDTTGWSENLPYTKVIDIPGVKDTDEANIFPYTPHTLSGSAIDNTRKMASYITDADTGNGTLTLYCGKTKPTSSFDILVTNITKI